MPIVPRKPPAALVPRRPERRASPRLKFRRQRPVAPWTGPAGPYRMTVTWQASCIELANELLQTLWGCHSGNIGDMAQKLWRMREHLYGQRATHGQVSQPYTPGTLLVVPVLSAGPLPWHERYSLILAAHLRQVKATRRFATAQSFKACIIDWLKARSDFFPSAYSPAGQRCESFCNGQSYRDESCARYDELRDRVLAYNADGIPAGEVDMQGRHVRVRYDRMLDDALDRANLMAFYAV